jgi:hypothetical protein
LGFVASCLSLAAQTSSAQTVAVGNCRPHYISYSTISEAVGAVPPPTTVLVCPGTYPEQVVITTPMTLKGLSLGTGSNPVITVPGGGLVGSAQLSAQQATYDTFGPVNISNLIVDGTGAAINCATGELIGIEYVFANGTLEHVEVRNQSPGGCGFGIMLIGGDLESNSVNIKNSSIHDFDNTGVSADSNGGSGFLVNLTSNSIASTGSSVQAGVVYDMAQGTAAHNTIEVGGQTGLSLENYFCCATASQNTITGSAVGIYMGGSYTNATTTVTHNSLFKNGTGIMIYNGGGIEIIGSNAIVQSSTAGIDAGCASNTTVKYNTIFNAPVGIENIGSGDTVVPNDFYSVPTTTTTCP